MRRKTGGEKMTCPKCNKEAQVDWLFCPFCQNPLKEKCPECGEMEEIGRLVCEKKIKKIADELSVYTKKEEDKYFVLRHMLGWMVGLLLIIIIAAAFLASSPLTLITSLIEATCMVVTFGLCFWKILSKDFKVYHNAKKEFYNIHPDYAEILKKPKSADVKSSGGQKEEEK